MENEEKPESEINLLKNENIEESAATEISQPEEVATEDKFIQKDEELSSQPILKKSTNSVKFEIDEKLPEPKIEKAEKIEAKVEIGTVPNVEQQNLEEKKRSGTPKERPSSRKGSMPLTKSAEYPKPQSPRPAIQRKVSISYQDVSGFKILDDDGAFDFKIENFAATRVRKNVAPKIYIVPKVQEAELIDGKLVPAHKRVPYRGGYIHKLTKVEYFNAATQTPRPQKYTSQNCPQRFHREIQTKFTKNRVVQTRTEDGTQVNKTGCFVTLDDSRIVIPQKYETSEEYEAKRLHATIRIQCFVRRVNAIRIARDLYYEKLERDRIVQEKEMKRLMLAEDNRKKEVESRLHPKTRKDFEALYHGLEKWRALEISKINKSQVSEPTRLALLSDLLDKECQLIQKIDKLKLVANEETKLLGIEKLLNEIASPIRFPLQSGQIAEVLTPNIIRAIELKDLYTALNLQLISVDERLQVLLHAKYTVKEFDASITREIVELIDREGDLLSRGVNVKNLDGKNALAKINFAGLRKRISNLFLVFLKTPEFNPEAGKHQKFPEAGKAWEREKSVYYCRGCTKYLPSTNFTLSTTMKHLGKCKNCLKDENCAIERVKDSMYMIILNEARNNEILLQRKEIMSSDNPDQVPVVHQSVQLMREADMRYLIDTIWGCQSAVSASTKLEDFALIRWNMKQDLSPWNCILLTKAEALVHQMSDNAHTELYSLDFVQKIEQKHLAAKVHYAQIPRMQEYVKESFYEEKRTGKIMHRKMVAF